MKKTKDNREYYEVFDLSPSRKEKRNRFETIYAVVVTVILLSLMALPAVLGLLFSSFMSSQGASESTVEVVGFIVIIALYVVVIALIFAVAGNLAPVVDKIRSRYFGFTKKYYFNVPQAYKKVLFEQVSDGGMLDSFYLDGAFCTQGDLEQDRLSYIYNVLNDEYDLHGADITLYKIAKEDFLKHFTFYDSPFLIRCDIIYVLPLSVLGIDRREYGRLREENKEHGFYKASLSDFADLVEARSDYRCTTFQYKEAAREFFKDKM